MLTRKAMFEAHQAERAAWAEERTRLINALLAKNAGDFALRQRSAEPAPLVDPPREAREHVTLPMGM